jgi:hypothetical protein
MHENARIGDELRGRLVYRPLLVEFVLIANSIFGSISNVGKFKCSKGE